MVATEQDIVKIIQEDADMMALLKAVRSMYLPDWWICAGFVRGKIWDTLHGLKTPLPDIDVIYFDKKSMDEERDKQLEKELHQILSPVPWSVKNQARMHNRNHVPPYTSSEDAISKFPETATALGVRLDQNEKVILTAPHGIKDAIQLEVRPTTYFLQTEERMKIYRDRVSEKNWQLIWNKVKIHYI
ncbi:nucleotidyltransferase family protein [Virgibacillus pantothenticus]|uniref:Nucleotidyltransferase family protein n=1 Tax=Virgibacillus pantothenticus TaxID=1473 RepID=A0A0L0QSH5_VIRPA|nr:nucleotidyltransferase family protein [Virgibacillus pantothenticus]KNE21113.1 hypothetical protein AFK71_05305 [Virgibacillus pantothenticus]MED3737186.1 nucleotidyltransferase family protein [Virgibacillus pantothenticus]QTY16474.1 nucleotidyltransferase family protein [Virgibacillus pantothenticus]SIT06714.1 hypothetical protein SAMN05421787_11371 [Virgibacillus pantothenticus]